MANTIDLMGVLNSITKDKVIAKADQVEITLYDGSKKKIPTELINYVKGVSANQIIEFLEIAQSSVDPITEDYLFICTESTSLDYEVGHIYFYDGATTSLTDITVSGGGGGGSTSSVRIQVTAPSGELAANTAFDVSYAWTSKNSGYGLVYCLVDGTINTRARMQPGAGTWSLSSGLSRGTHTLTVYVIDSGGISSEQWSKTITVGSLAIETSFNESNIYTLGSKVSIPYIYYTNDTDYINELLVTIDNEETITADAGTQGIQISYTLSSLAAGNHHIKLQIRSYKMKDEELEDEKFSNILNLQALVAAKGVLYADIYDASEFSIKQREKVTLSVRTTYIGASSFTAVLEAYRQVGSEWVLDSTKYASDAVWYNGVNSFIISNITEVGEYKFIVRVSYTNKGTTVYPETDPTFYVHVTQADTLHINSVVDESLLLHLSASGKSNTSLDKNVWKDTSKEEILEHNPNADLSDRTDTNVSMVNFNYSSNGWLEDSNGQTRLVINGGSYVEIDLAPLAEEVSNGLTFDIEFATEDILDASARVVSCFDGTRGFWIDTENATLSNNNSKLEKVTTATEVTNPNIILRYDNKLDADGNYVYIDNVTGEETTEAETNGVANDHAQTPVYMTYLQYTQTGPFQTNFPSNEKTRIAFVIQRGERAVSGDKDFGDYNMACMCIYVNGVLTSMEKITDYTDLIGVQFENGGKKITLGCDNDYNHKGKAEIYNIRLYNRALSMEEILTNYISDIEDPVEQDSMIHRNALLGTSSTDLPVMEFYFTEDDWKNLSKENKMFGRVTFTNFNGTTENFDTQCRCSWQGTSTLAYAVKNYKIQLYDTLKWKNGKRKGDVKHKFDLGNGIKEYIFTLKADYMDSSLMRNTATGNYVCDLGTELTPAQEYIPACRSAIYGFPILLYLTTMKSRDVNDELIPSAEDPGTRQLLGVYNMNLDKNCTDSLGLYTRSDIRGELNTDDLADFDANYPNWDCMSFEGSANSDTTAGAFASIDDSSIYSDFEMRFEDIEDILDDGKKQSFGGVTVNNETVTITGINSDINGVYTKTSPNKLVGSRLTLVKDTDDIDTSIIGNYTTDYDFKYDNKIQQVTLAIQETTSGAYTITSTESAESRIARRYGHLKKFIKWVKDSDVETFKKDFQKHANLSAVLDYFLTVFVMLMADNLGKNCMWNTWGPVSVAKKTANPDKYVYTKQELYDYDDYIWYPQFYDMDTCLGLDNSGNMRFDVHEEIEQGVFNTSGSLFWTKFREAFADEILNRYKELRSEPSASETRKAAYTTESFLKYYYTNQVAKISETNYNNNIKQKYLAHEDYLFMMHGRQYEYFRRWIDQRLYFIDTLYEYGEDWGKESTVRVEYSDFATIPVRFSISTYRPSYVAVKFSATTGNTKKLKVPRGATVTFEGWVSTSTDQEVILFDSPNIKTIGDISVYSPKVVELSRMTKLTSLCVGSEEHPNPNLSSISLGNNTYLTELIAENCTAISGPIDVSSCTNLKYISTVGSTIPYVRFNEAGGALEEAKFSYATTTVNLQNFQLLNKISFESLESLTTLQVINCPIITGTIDDSGNVTQGYIMNILNKWEPADKSTRITLDVYGNLPRYEFLDCCSVLHEKYGLTSRRINLTGDITYTGDTIPERYSTYSSAIRDNNYFPDLKIHYPNVTDFSTMFANYKNINAIEHQAVPITDVLGNVTYQTRYYWKDAKEDQFAEQLDAEENEVGVRKRQVKYYDADDMVLLADEIKDRMSPFSRATNLNEMFFNDDVLEYIYPDTFEHMDIRLASTISMFNGCKNLRYIEGPKVDEYGALMFSDCSKMLLYIPSTVLTIHASAFLNNSYLYGIHPVFLFENERTVYDKEIPYVRDARFGVVRNTATGRALRTSDESIINVVSSTDSEGNVTYTEENVPVHIEYFLDNKGSRILYSIMNSNYQSDIKTVNVESINCMVNLDGTLNTLKNPMNVSDLLYGSLKYINTNTLQRMAVPTYNITNASPNTTPLYKEEISIAKLFYDFADSITDTNIVSLGALTHITLLTDNNSTISDYYMQSNRSITSVLAQKSVQRIGKYAFHGTNITTFEIEDVSNSVLTAIGMFAFAESKLERIVIPDSVTEIGERAYEKINTIGWLQYSNNMTYVPIGCFNKCNTGIIKTENIFGFNPEKLEIIYDYAFNDAKGLLIVGIDTDSNDKYNCYWRSDPTKSKFLDYFPKLSYIGNSAFLNILNIRSIKLNPVLKNINVAAFIPDSSEYGIPTLLEWNTSDMSAYSDMHIYANAFAGRQFDWNSNGIGGFTGIIENTVYVPKEVGVVSSDAFSPESTMALTGGFSVVEFVMTDAETLPENWDDDFVLGQTNTVFNYKKAYLDNDGESLYFLLNDNTAKYMKLLKKSVALTVKSKITDENISYTVTEIANNALCENDENLNNIIFAYGSVITKFGTDMFDTNSIISLSLEEDSSVYIPKTVTEIGEGTPFKNTSWFSMQMLDDFLYLNDVCLGYSENSKTLVESITDVTSPLSIKSTTKVIYDNAFSNTNITGIALPEKLERIGDSAFAGCIQLTNIDFTPCAGSLAYIGSNVFSGDTSLKSMRYTRRLTHVGKNAVKDCKISSFIFDQGCQLDATSQPIIASTTDTEKGLDTTITFMKISNSMGQFFSPVGAGYIEFSKLSNIETLILGEYEEVTLDEVPTDELTESETDDGNTYYKLNYHDYYENGTYVNGYNNDTPVYDDIILHVKEQTFYKPLGTYTSDIDISKITTNLLTQDDVIRIVMGYKEGETHNIKAKQDFATKFSAAKYSRMFNNRVSVTKVSG